MTKIYRNFTVFFFLMIIVIPSAFAAEGKDSISLQPLDEQIKDILISEIKKNPNIRNCQVTIMIDFQKTQDSSKWDGKMDSISISAQKTSSEDLANDEGGLANDETDDSCAESGADDSYIGSNIIGWLLGVAVVAIFMVIAYPSLKKRLRKLPLGDNNPDDKTSTLTGNLGNNRQNFNPQPNDVRPSAPESKRNQEKPIEKKEETPLQETKKPLEAKPATKSVSEVEERKTVVELEPANPVAPVKPIVKYGQIAVLSKDELVTEKDYMFDNEQGMPFEFSFSPSMEEGTYDIASSSRQSFLRDTDMVRPYVQEFDIMPNPTVLVTISKGKLRKKGMQWVVVEKAKIELR